MSAVSCFLFISFQLAFASLGSDQEGENGESLLAKHLSPEMVSRWNDDSTTLAVVFVHKQGQKSDFMRAVADLASLEAAAEEVSIVVGTVDVHQHPTALHVFGVKDVPAVHVFPAGLGAHFPIKIPYAEPLPERHYIDRVRRIHSLASDANGDSQDVLSIIADFAHASDYEAQIELQDAEADGRLHSVNSTAVEDAVGEHGASAPASDGPRRFSSGSLANATLTLLEGRIKGLQTRMRRLEVLRAAVRLMQERGTAAIATEVSSRQQAMLSSGTYSSQNNVEQRDLLLLETAVLRRAMRAALDPGSDARRAAAARAERVAQGLPLVVEGDNGDEDSGK